MMYFSNIQLLRFFLFLILGVFPFRISGQENVVSNGASPGGDVMQLFENHTEDINILNNDYGLEAGVESVHLSTSPQFGKAEVLPDFQIRYTPKRNFIGNDRLVYKVCEKNGSCGKASVEIVVVNYDFKPSAVNDSLRMIYGLYSGIRFDILNNDINAYDEPFEIEFLTQPVNGHVVVNEDNTITPAFQEDFIGSDSLIYKMTDAEGDCDTASVYFTVLKGDGIKLFIPNAFSPNGDGINDNFRLPQVTSDVEMSMRIFTQWGQVVYESINYSNDWDGRGNLGVYNNKELLAGTYYYVLLLGDRSDLITGYIYLSR